MRWMVVAVLALMTQWAVASVDNPTKDELVSFVKEAVAFAKEKGNEAAFKAFMNKEDKKWHRGELYIFAYDFEGKVVAHGAKPHLVGKNLISLKDPNGVKIIKGLIDAVNSGDGYLRFMWAHPKQKNKNWDKLGYAEKVDEKVWLGSGIYKNDKNKDLFK